MNISDDQQLADIALAARNAGAADLPAGFWQLPLQDKAATATAMLAELRGRAAQGDRAARDFLASPWASSHVRANAAQHESHDHTAAARIVGEVIESLPPYPGGFAGRGIVTCAGGPLYQTCAWVLFTLLRKLGCKLPIECWYAGSGERDAHWERWVSDELGVVCVDAIARGYVGHPFAPGLSFRNHAYSPGALHGYALKPFAVLNSSFQDILFLDADNTPERDPTFMFDSPEFRAAGAIFWPDLPDCALTPVLPAFDVCDTGEPINWESGQLVIDKARVWRPLWLANWFNAQAGHFYRFSWGDCGAWQAAWKRLSAPWAMPGRAARRAGNVALIQHDFQGEPLFFHRVGRRGKWRLDFENEPTPGYSHNELCFAALADLANRQQGRKRRTTPPQGR